MEIENNAFLVTGGGSGLGAATARLLAEAGGNVLIADVNDEAGERLAGEIGEKARMPKAPVPAARSALTDAALKIEDVDAIKTHNPFAVNDVYFSRQMGVSLEAMNDYGSSLIFGHPQGPTGARLIAELIEILKRRGGGVGLFTGCAAGDTGAALVLRVED